MTASGVRMGDAIGTAGDEEGGERQRRGIDERKVGVASRRKEGLPSQALRRYTWFPPPSRLWVGPTLRMDCAGDVADLVLLSGNPLLNISNMRTAALRLGCIVATLLNLDHVESSQYDDLGFLISMTRGPV